MKIYRLSLISLAIVLQVACSSEPVKKDKTNPAAYDAGAFIMEKEMPVRQPSDESFFYKRCDLNQRKAYVDKIEYNCN